MGWNFWTRKKDREMSLAMAESIARTEGLQAQINNRLLNIEQRLQGSSEQVAEIGEQVRKLSRLQYKMGQESLGKLEGLGTSLSAVQQWQATYTMDRNHLDACEQQLDYLEQVLLTWLDDFDLLANRLREPGQELWQQLLTKWTSQTLQALQVLGMQEIKALGTSFNPQIAECIGTIGRPPVTISEGKPTTNQGEPESSQPSVPYQIAEVVKRGFVGADGNLKRKAHVIIYEE